MKFSVTANQLNGRAIGSLFFSGFGAAWLLLALYLRERLNAPSIAGIGCVLGGLVLGAFVLIAEARRWPKEADDPRRGKVFHRINAIQWISIFAIVTVLNRLHLYAYTVPAIACIVGLHLFPLARLFRNRLHFFTGSALVAWALGTALWIPAEKLQSATAFGAGVILWFSSAATLALAFESTQRAKNIPTLGSAIQP